MIGFSRRAVQQINALSRHYRERERPDALRKLIATLREAAATIENDPGAGLSAPRPYPALRRPGVSWMKAGRYWIAYRQKPHLAITAVFYDTANIPRRM